MFEKKESSKLERYEDVTGEFTSRELKWGEWYVRHKLLLRKIVIWALACWSVITVGYGLGYFVYYFSYGYFQDQRMASQQLIELSSLKNTRQLFQAQDLQIGSVEVYNSISEDLYDFSVRAKNPNDSFVAIVTYRFIFSGGETDLAQTIILPGSERPIVYFGFETVGYPANPKLVIENIDWKRINVHFVDDPASFIADRSNFLVENFEFIRASQSQGIPNHIIEFDLFNDTAYNYWDPVFYVELIRGNRTVGIIYYVATELHAGEIRHVDLRSYVDNFDVTNINVWPVVNVFDRSEFMQVSS